MPIDDLTALGQIMREARKKKDLTQQELSDQSHVSVKQIANIEKGQMNPSYSFLSSHGVCLRVTFLFRLKIEDMPLDYTGVPLDFDFPALLAGKGGLIPALCEKQPHLITGAAVGGTGMLNTKLKHPAGIILKTLNGENVMSF